MTKLTKGYMVEKLAINQLKEIGYSYIQGSKLPIENEEREIAGKGDDSIFAMAQKQQVYNVMSNVKT